MTGFDELVSMRAQHLRKMLHFRATASAELHPELWQGKMSRDEYMAEYKIGFLSAQLAAYQIQKEAAR